MSASILWYGRIPRLGASFWLNLAGHVANAYEQALGLDREQTMKKITDLLVAELTRPTDKARGKMQNTRPPHRGR